jgi:heat shock protein HtpX
VKNRDMLISTIAATLAGAITYLAHMAQWGAMFGGRRDDEEGGSNPIAMILLAILAPIAAMLVQMAVSRSREFQADATGARVAGRPWGLMKALEKLQMANQQMPMADATPATAHLFIVNPLSGEAFMRLFSTHPPLEERIARLRSMRV